MSNSTSMKVPLKTLFLNLQKQMAAQLSTDRCIVHEGKKGDASEECWRKMLRKYLPKRYRIESAIIVDCLDHCSDQIDIVVFDQQYSPFIFNQDDFYYVPAESVYAVIEAKQEIDKGMIEYAAEKAESVRKLKRTNAFFQTASGRMRKPSLFEIPAGIVTLSSGWNPPLGDAFHQAINSVANRENQWLDFGCVIECGAFNVEYDEHKAPSVEIRPAELSLVTFIWQLVARLQSAGTVSAIEVDEYFKSIS